MDGLTSALMLLVLAAGGWALAMRSSAGATTVIGQLFYVPEPRWPTGVQEDDDLRWSWARTRPPAATGSPIISPTGVAAGPAVPGAAGVLPEAVVVDGAAPICTAPVRGVIARR